MDSSQSPCSTVLQIPELLDIIIGHVDTSTALARCARLNSFWHRHVVPVLWRGSIPLDSSQPQYLRAPPLQAMLALTLNDSRFRHYMYHVKQIDWNDFSAWPEQFDAKLWQWCSYRMLSIHFGDVVDPDTIIPLLIPSLRILEIHVSQLSGLLLDAIDGMELEWLTAHMDPDMFALSVSKLRRQKGLVGLNLIVNGRVPRLDIDTWSVIEWPFLKHMDLDLATAINYRMLQDPFPFPALQSLEMMVPALEPFRRLLKRIPHLRRVFLGPTWYEDVDWDDPPEMAYILEALTDLGGLEEVTLGFLPCEIAPNAALEAFAKASPRLRVFRVARPMKLSYRRPVLDIANLHIAEFLPNLTTLSISMHCQGDALPFLEEILRHCTLLDQLTLATEPVDLFRLKGLPVSRRLRSLSLGSFIWTNGPMANGDSLLLEMDAVFPNLAELRAQTGETRMSSDAKLAWKLLQAHYNKRRPWGRFPFQPRLLRQMQVEILKS